MNSNRLSCHLHALQKILTTVFSVKLPSSSHLRRHKRQSCIFKGTLLPMCRFNEKPSWFMAFGPARGQSACCQHNKQRSAHSQSSPFKNYHKFSQNLFISKTKVTLSDLPALLSGVVQQKQTPSTFVTDPEGCLDLGWFVPVSTFPSLNIRQRK